MSEEARELILIVDDEPRNLQVLGTTLRHRGFKIGIAQNGQQALDFVERHIPDLILLDVMMPGMDGFEVCQRMKQLETIKEVPVLFITALADSEGTIKGFKSGGADYIHKPFIQEEVIARITVHLDNRRFVKELQEKNQHLAELNQLKNKFLGMAAHDLRNPLGSIMGFMELMVDGDFGEVNDTQEPILRKIYDTSQRMLNLINDLLDVSVIESGNLNIEKVPSSIKSVLEERIRMITPVAEKKNITIHEEEYSDTKSLFDEERIIQVIDNIIGNAIKFSPEGSEIRTRVLEQGDQIVFHIQDQGPGISEEEQKLIFGEFQRLSSKPTAGEKSTGLGMAISKKIVDAHGGNIQIESTVGVGTTFIVSLPMT